MHLLFSFLVLRVVYMEEISLGVAFLKISIVIGVFMVNSLLAMLLLYIAKLHKRMNLCTVENIKLLDGMHEGLLILSKAAHISIFCNQPAEKILTRAMAQFKFRS